MRSVSLIVPFYNASATIDALLDSIESQSLPREQFEVILVNDGSTDDSPDRIASRPGMRLLNQANLGPGAARNAGSRIAEGDILVFTDADCILPPDFLEMHRLLHRENDRVDGICAGVGPGTPLSFASACMADHLCSWFNAHPGLPEREPEYLWGANMSLKRRVHAAGIRWSQARVTGEDVAFSRDMTRRGMRLRFFPNPAIGHQDRATLRGFLRHQYNWGHHAPFIRGQDPEAAYAYLFPPHFMQAMLRSPAIVLGYTALTIKSWCYKRPLALLSTLPLIVLGKLYYAIGVLDGTRALQHGLCDRVADRRAW